MQQIYNLLSSTELSITAEQEFRKYQVKYMKFFHKKQLNALSQGLFSELIERKNSGFWCPGSVMLILRIEFHHVLQHG
jgi:hypothetical protein